MMTVIEKLVSFKFESAMKQFLTIILTLLISFVHAQEKDKDLIKSNDYVYEGNQVVSNDFIEAEMEYRKAISKKPSNVNGSYNLGNAYYNTGNYNEALMRHLEAAKTATSKEEKHRAFHNAGNAFMKQNMCKEAVEAFKSALRNNPSDDETRYNLVVAKECAKNQQEQNQDDKKEDKDEENEDKKEDEKKEENKDEGEEEKKDGDDQKDDEGNPNDEKDNQQKGDPKDKKKKPQQQPGKLSPQQIKNLLEAMNNEEKKVQQKINAKKATGKKIKAEKDW